MRAGWVAATVRGRLLLSRTLGREASLALAATPTLEAALGSLAGTAYGRYVETGDELGRAQHDVTATTLWHLRVLAGWVPPSGAEAFRSLAAWFELANIEDRLAYLAGAPLQVPYELGSLASAWPQVASAQSAGEIREQLRRSVWGDPGGESAEEVHLGLRLGWARRLLEHVPEATRWVAGALAVGVARRLFVETRPIDHAMQSPLRVLGSGWEDATSLSDLAQRLPARAAWPLSGIDSADRLWEAELAWWSGVETDARALVLEQAGRGIVIGVVALLGVDAWRVSAALEVAAHGGRPELVKELSQVA